MIRWMSNVKSEDRTFAVEQNRILRFCYPERMEESSWASKC